MEGGLPSEFMSVMDRRGDVLRELDEGPLDKGALEDRLGVSRSTVDRGVRELEEAGLVERADGGYRRTLPGRLALEEYDRFRRRVEELSEGISLLSTLGESAPVDGDLMTGARVVEATRASPQRHLEALYDVVERATSVRGFGAAIHPMQVETYRRRLLEEGMEAEVVLTETAVERLLAEYADTFQAAIESGAVEFWRTDDRLEYALTIAETPDGPEVGVLVYGDDGTPGCILNDTPAALEWADEQFERVRAAAEPVGGRR